MKKSSDIEYIKYLYELIWKYVYDSPDLLRDNFMMDLVFWCFFVLLNYLINDICTCCTKMIGFIEKDI